MQAWLLVLQLGSALLGLEAAVAHESLQEWLSVWVQGLEKVSAALEMVLAWGMACSTSLCPIQTRRWEHC